MYLKKISIENKKFLILQQHDGCEHRIKIMNLRRNCPCAICKAENEERGSKYIPLYTLEQITIDKLVSVGHYGLSITWRDQHNTGIYEYSLLESLSEKSSGA